MTAHKRLSILYQPSPIVSTSPAGQRVITSKFPFYNPLSRITPGTTWLRLSSLETDYEIENLIQDLLRNALGRKTCQKKKKKEEGKINKEEEEEEELTSIAVSIENSANSMESFELG